MFCKINASYAQVLYTSAKYSNRTYTSTINTLVEQLIPISKEQVNDCWVRFTLYIIKGDWISGDANPNCVLEVVRQTRFKKKLRPLSGKDYEHA